MAGMPICANCGAPLAANAASCGKCGMRRGAHPKAAYVAPARAATPDWPPQSQASRGGPVVAWWQRLSRNAKIGVGAAVIITLLVVGAVGAACGTPSATGSPGASTQAGVAAAPTKEESTASGTATASAASTDADDESGASAGASFAPNATGALPPSPGGSSADRLPGEPDPKLTPGALNPAVTQATIGSTICVSGWTATIRPSESFTNSLKVQQIGQYGYSNTSTAAYEEDHLISLELGGAPADPRNLWPEPYTASLADGRPTGAHTKDAFETKLKDEVCAGSITLAQGQADIGDHWVHAYYGIALTSSATNPAMVVAPTAAPTAAASPVATAPSATLTVTITSLPASIAPGANATLTAATSPGATCGASVTYGSGTVSSAAGLKAQPVAGSSGSVSWTWKVGSSTKAGTSTAEVTCTLGGAAAGASKPFEVT